MVVKYFLWWRETTDVIVVLFPCCRSDYLRSVTLQVLTKSTQSRGQPAETGYFFTFSEYLQTCVPCHLPVWAERERGTILTQVEFRPSWLRPRLDPPFLFCRQTLGVVKKTSLRQLSRCQFPDEGKLGPLQSVPWSRPSLCWNNWWASHRSGLRDSEDYKLKIRPFCRKQ